MSIARDTLFLLTPGFEDPAYPGTRFFCWHCALIEGLLAGFPEQAARIDVVRVAWPRPRQQVIASVGEENQSLPLLVLAGEGTNSRRMVAGKDAILEVLNLRHGFPSPHP